MFAVHWHWRQIHKSSWNPSLYFGIFEFWGPVGGTSPFIPALFFFFFKLQEINRRNSHGKVRMVSPLREPFFNEGWQAETSHFTLLAAGPGTFCVTVQGGNWLQPRVEFLVLPCPEGAGPFPRHYSQKDPPESAACVCRLGTVEKRAGHLLVTSPDCNGFTPQGAAVAKLPGQRRGSGWRGPRGKPQLCASCFPQPGSSRHWAWIPPREGAVGGKVNEYCSLEKQKQLLLARTTVGMLWDILNHFSTSETPE